MILTDIAKALSQIGDTRFRRVLMIGLAVTLAVLLVAYAGTVWLVAWLVPDTLSLPWIGPVTFLDNAASAVSLIAVMVLSVFLMTPVASAVIGVLLDDIADAVETRHYPHLAPAMGVPILTSVTDAAQFLGVMVVLNVLALVLYIAFTPFAPLIFWALNGLLLGREYFQLVAMRRLGRVEATKMRRRHSGTIFVAGGLMAIPLTVPVVNLLVPIVGAATFTHVYHRLAAKEARDSIP